MVKDDRQVVLERFAVRTAYEENKKKSKWHYIAANAAITVCGQFVRIHADERSLISDDCRIDHTEICGTCRHTIERRAKEGRVVRLARLKEGRGNAAVMESSNV